jgi:TolB-like protein/Tfp pilus assembly protein PilF/predicted Ser/Thr protein kinase
MPLAAGEKLGPYEVIAPIGEGGMGEVWKARDPRLDRTVAIKRLKGQHAARFAQEARAIAALNHPHVCQIYDVGPDYLVMEYVEGRPLCGPLPVPEAVRLALQIAGALEEAHGRGILHRDLKPGNILVTAKGGAKLLDFGLAKLMTDIAPDATRTVEGAILGTIAYMAPEQAEGKPLDARSDIFSFGAVLYEMLSGARAFGGSSTAQVMSAVMRDQPLPPAGPPELQRVVSRCLAKQPGDRFPSAAALRAALEEVLAQPAQPPSIAVLPFANMSREADDEYFGDGLAEEIINVLAQVPGLKVTARTSAFAFRGKEQDITKIAEALKVRTILEGSLRRAGNRIRITAQLINAADGYHLWSERYDRELNDIFAVQDEIATAIAGALQMKLSVKTTAMQRRAPKLPAYEAYLKARHHQWLSTNESLALSREYYERAIELDPEFALAYVGYADHFLFLAASGLMAAIEAMPVVRENAHRALEFDASLPEAHAMLGVVSGQFDHDWREAGRRFQLALALEPVPPLVRSWYGFFYLMYLGDPMGSAESHRRALQDDPLNSLFRSCLANSLALAGDFAGAEKEARQVLEANPDFILALLVAGLMSAAQGKMADALAFGERATTIYPWSPWGQGLLAGAAHATGDPVRAQAVLAAARAANEYSFPLAIASYHSCLGDTDAVVQSLDKAADQRYPASFAFLASSQRALRSSARWPPLAKKMNLPSTATT